MWSTPPAQHGTGSPQERGILCLEDWERDTYWLEKQQQKADDTIFPYVLSPLWNFYVASTYGPC